MFMVSERQYTERMLSAALSELLVVPEDGFYEYDNPFEKKLALKDVHNLPPGISVLVKSLENSIEYAEEYISDDLYRDSDRHFFGVYKYRPGDYLGVHVDAGIHPNGKLRAATLLLYLNSFGDGGELEFWEGSRCTEDVPSVDRRIATIFPTAGMTVLFENDDFAWHSVTRNVGEETRAVIMVSFLSDYQSWNKDRQNRNKKAFFVPRPGETWPQSFYAIRDKRINPETSSSVYRV